MSKSGHSKRTGKYNGSKWIRPEKRLALYVRDNFHCVYCGRDLKDAEPQEITLDHLLPRVAGGGNENTNLVTACRTDNSGRGSKPWMDFATPAAVERIQHLRHMPVNVKLAKAILEDRAGDPEVEALR
jgi:5-methylcytosine-specific restriction endonuclease McrA